MTGGWHAQTGRRICYAVSTSLNGASPRTVPLAYLTMHSLSKRQQRRDDSRSLMMQADVQKSGVSMPKMTSSFHWDRSYVLT